MSAKKWNARQHKWKTLATDKSKRERDDGGDDDADDDGERGKGRGGSWPDGMDQTINVLEHICWAATSQNCARAYI